MQPSRQICPTLGNVNIPQEEVDKVVLYLKEKASSSFQGHMARWIKKEKKGLQCEVFFTLCLKSESIFNYLYSYPQHLKNSEIRYRADLQVAVSELDNLQEPLKSFLITIASRVQQIFSDFLHWKFDLRLEKGMSYTKSVEIFHRDSFAASVTTCYSNVEGWATKVVNPLHYGRLNIPFERSDYLYEYQEQLKGVEEDAVFGELQNVNEVIHRGPNLSDLKSELEIDDFRLFIRMRSEHRKF